MRKSPLFERLNPLVIVTGEPVDILVNHKLIAKGEVVVIDENFGVRVTEIVSPMERMADFS